MAKQYRVYCDGVKAFEISAHKLLGVKEGCAILIDEKGEAVAIIPVNRLIAVASVDSLDGSPNGGEGDEAKRVRGRRPTASELRDR